MSGHTYLKYLLLLAGVLCIGVSVVSTVVPVYYFIAGMVMILLFLILNRNKESNKFVRKSNPKYQWIKLGLTVTIIVIAYVFVSNDLNTDSFKILLMLYLVSYIIVQIKDWIYRSKPDESNPKNEAEESKNGKK